MSARSTFMGIALARAVCASAPILHDLAASHSGWREQIIWYMRHFVEGRMPWQSA